jgi:hypothetical protein
MRSIPCPTKVYTNQMVVAKARNPDAPLEGPSKIVTDLLARPAAIEKNAAAMDQKLNAVFTIAAEDISEARAKIPRAPRAAPAANGNNLM